MSGKEFILHYLDKDGNERKHTFIYRTRKQAKKSAKRIKRIKEGLFYWKDLKRVPKSMSVFRK